MNVQLCESCSFSLEPPRSGGAAVVPKVGWLLNHPAGPDEPVGNLSPDGGTAAPRMRPIGVDT
eukprot:873672-Alexandrium_andersonii.AAC.1